MFEAVDEERGFISDVHFTSIRRYGSGITRCRSIWLVSKGQLAEQLYEQPLSLVRQAKLLNILSYVEYKRK